MGVSVEIKANNVEQVLSEMKDKKKAALEAIGQAAESYAKLNLESNPRRIDTGNLRNSISHTTDEDTAYIGTNVEYAIYVELGTRHMEASHYLKRAASDHGDEYKAVAEEHMKG